MRCVVNGMPANTGSIYRDTNALTERRKPADRLTTECAKLKKAGRARTRGGPDRESILVVFCVFVAPPGATFQINVRPPLRMVSGVSAKCKILAHVQSTV